MPDQSTAAEEYSLLSELAQPQEEPYEDDLAPEGEVEFPVVLRGYDRFAVDAYVRHMARRITDLQADHEPDGAVRRALQRVGEDVSGILQRAHETAARVTANSRREAEERLERARQEAADIIAVAQRRLAAIDADADRIWAERARIVEDARSLSAELAALADGAAKRFPPAPPEEDVDTEEVYASRRLPAGGQAPVPPPEDEAPRHDVAELGSGAAESAAGNAAPPAGGELCEEARWEPPVTAEWPLSGRGAWGAAANGGGDPLVEADGEGDGEPAQGCGGDGGPAQGCGGDGGPAQG
jgi:hypothetical protein